MKQRFSLVFLLAVALSAITPYAHADNIVDSGSGTFEDIYNSGTLDYVLVNNGATIGTVTNADDGVLNATTPPTTINLKCCGSFTFNIGINENATVTGDVVNDGTISQTNGSNNAAGILISNDSSVGGNVTNTGTVTITTSGQNTVAAGIFIGNGSTITGNVTNAGTITATASDTAYGIYNDGTITAGITNTGTITATSRNGYAIYNNGSALTINQNAGSITGSINLSGNGDTLNINGGTVTGRIYGGSADQVNLTSGTLTVPGNQNVNSVGTYTQGASGNLVLQVSTNGPGTISSVDTINLGSTLVISPQGGGFLTPHTYTDVIDANTSLTGSFASVTSDSARYTVSLTADGSTAYDLMVTWLGSASGIADNGSGSFSSINNTATSDYIAVAGGGTIGSITNASTGVITGNSAVFVTTDCCNVYASTLSVDGSTVTGNITNNGTITLTNDDNNLAGVLIANASSIGGNITNNGAITVTAPDNSAAGIFIDTPVTVTGDVVNGGTITVTSGSDGQSLGIWNNGTITGNLTNSGTITATSAEFGSSAGIENDGTITGNLTNSGTISATVGVSEKDTVFGIYNNRAITGDIVNSGTITVTTPASDYLAGIENDSTISGGITNSGTITGMTDQGNISGITNGSTIGESITNSGTITATTGNNGNAYSVQNYGTITGDVVNSGTLTAAETGSGTAYGIYNQGTITGSIANSATISATASDTAYGIYNNGTITGGITNTGTISATGDTAYAIYNGGAALTINQNAGSITGEIHLSGNGDTLNIAAGTVTGSISGGSADQVNLTGGTLSVPGAQSINGIGTYTQGASGTLVLQYGSSGPAMVGANTITLDGALVISPQGGGFLAPQTYTGVISAGTSLSGSFASVTSDSARYTVSLTADGSTAYDLMVTWLGSASGIADNGSGSFSSINNTGTADYIALAGGGMIGSITNASSGIITGNSAVFVNTDCCGVYASMLSVDGATVTGSITNNGAIALTNDDNNVAGILIANASSIGGSIVNTGTITVKTSSDYTAEGILIDDIASVTGNVVNTGTITATGGEAYGISNTGTITGNVTNSGTITSTGGGESSGSIFSNGEIGGNLTNAGTIATTDGNGVINGGMIGGSLINSGTITVTAGATGNWAGGLFNQGTITNGIVNSGTITSIEESDNINAAFGIGNIHIISAGGITNSGTITATMMGDGNVGGILSDDTVTGDVMNSGAITITGTNTNQAIGILAGGTITGNVTNSGTIAVTATGSGLVSGIYNVGTITGGIVNTGTITATATDGGTAYAIYSHGTAMTIDQNAGAINGTVGLSGADTFNIAGGTVTGSVTGNSNGFIDVTDTVNLTGGTLALSSTDSVSAIGTYTQGAGGTLALAVTPSTSATVGATNITLGGTLKLLPQGSGWVLGTPVTYTDVISAGTSLSGSFASISTPALFEASLVPDGSTALNLSVTEVPAATSSPAVNALISGLLGNGSNNAAAQSLATALEGLTAPQLQGAVTQLSGPGVAQSIQALRAVSSDLSGAVGQRLLNGGAYNTSNLMSVSMVNNHMQVASSDTTSSATATTPASGDPWMRGFGSFASGAAQDGMSGFHQERGGVILGADQYLDDNWTLGAAVQYAHTSLSYNDGSASSGADSYNGILYDGWRDGELYVNSTAGFGWNSYGSNRTLIIGGYTATPSGSFSGWDASASAETGYTVQAGTLLALPPEMLTLTPYAGLDYTRTHTDGFTESGDGVSNLIFQASDGNSLVSTVGVRAGTRVEIPDYGAFLPEIHLAWQRENMDQTQNSNAAFVASPGSLFSVTGAQYGRESAITGFSLTQELSQQFKAFLTYDAKLNGGYTEQAISAGLRVEF